MGLRTPTSPSSPRLYSTFLKAQESSPTLVLAHAKIGDSGAQEVAEFASRSPHLRLLDLTGCDVTSTGVLHVAEALRCSLTLESLVLRHNDLTAGPAGEEGLAALCQAARSSSSLRHLDLRYCGLSGESAAGHVASILQGNGGLSHLELSWNSLGASGGQVLLQNIRATSGLYDCQLTGCRLAAETLQGIAELLVRNRKAHKASLQAGPYKGSWIKDEREPGAAPGMRSQGQAAAVNLPLRSNVADIPGNAAVSDEKTQEIMERLFELRRGYLSVSSAEPKLARIHEFMEYLTTGQKETLEHEKAADEILNRTELIVQGFQDRELRYRGTVASGRDELLSYAREYTKLQANHRRAVEDLSIMREDLEIAQDEIKRFQRRCEDEEDHNQGTYNALRGDCKELSRKLAELQDRGTHLDAETKMLRCRAEQVRERVANEIV